MLQQSLEGLLLEGLQTSNVDIIRHCLRTYATIDKTRDAEALVGQVLVKPYVDEVCASGVGSFSTAMLCCLRFVMDTSEIQGACCCMLARRGSCCIVGNWN